MSIVIIIENAEISFADCLVTLGNVLKENSIDDSTLRRI